MGIAVLIGAVLVSVVGCGRFAYEFRVRNASDTTFFVRVHEGGEWSDSVQVGEVEPGADGVAVMWAGDENVAIELLDDSCQVLGTFQSAESSGTMTVPGVDGLQGTVAPWAAFRPYGSGTRLTTKCGGVGPTT